MVKHSLVLVGILALICFSGGCILDTDDDSQGKYDVEGYVLDGSDSPVSGVKITKLGGHGGYTYTDATGYYFVGNNTEGWDFCLVPSKTGCTFSPDSLCYADISRDYSSQNYTANCGDGKYDVEGYVLDGSGSPVSGVKITKLGGHGGYTYTDATGYYFVGNNTEGWDFCLVPSKTGCTFSPDSLCYADISRDYSSQNYTANCGGLISR